MNRQYILNILLLLCGFASLAEKPNVQSAQVKHTSIPTRIKEEIVPKTQTSNANIEQITNQAIEENNEQKTTINPWRLSAKIAVGAAVSLCAHQLLEYIAVYAHEHGHGFTGSDPNYTINLTPSNRLLAPWEGICYRRGINSSFSIAAGPLAGLCARYLQCIVIQTLDCYMHGKSLKESAQQSLGQPFLFFSKAKQTAKNYFSYILNKETDEQISEPTWSSTISHSILFLTYGAMLGEFIYGLTPYSYADLDGQGDGERLWKMINSNCPTVSMNLPTFVLGIMTTPYISGAIDAWQLENKDTIDNHTHI